MSSWPLDTVGDEELCPLHIPPKGRALGVVRSHSPEPSSKQELGGPEPQHPGGPQPTSVRWHGVARDQPFWQSQLSAVNQGWPELRRGDTSNSNVTG